MKYNEMDVRQKRAYKNIKNCAVDLVWGCVNTCIDNPKGSKEFEDAKSFIGDLKKLEEVVYRDSLESVYESGSVSFGEGAKKILNDIKFCGKEFLMEQVHKVCEWEQKDAIDDLRTQGLWD